MHTLRNRILLFGTTAAAGTASLALHRYMMTHCFDEKGLLIAGNLPGTLLWAAGIAFVAVLAVTLRTLGGDGTYADNFPRSLPSGALLLAAGAAMLLAVPGLDLGTGEPAPGATGLPLLLQQLSAAAVRYLPWLAAVSMAALGLFRLAGRKPIPLFSAIICLFYMLMLVTNYRLWSADPQLQEYAYQLLAGVLLMLCSFHRTCCDAGVIQRRKLLATGLSAAVCCMASLSGEFQWMFYLASALWAAGCQCSTAVLPPDPEPEPEEDAPNEGEAPEPAE